MFPGYRKYWWEEFLEIEQIYAWKRNDNRFILTNIETGLVVARGDSLLELNEQAVDYLNKLFEDVVLLNE